MRRGLVCGAMMLVSGSAMAETVLVRSGAHEGYSRLVLDMPRQIPFEQSGDGQTRNLAFAQDGLTFDTSAVFNRITTQRVARVAGTSGQSELVLTLNCDCEVETFWEGQSMLVVDVRDGPQSSPSAAERPDTTSGIDDIVAAMGAGLTPLTQPARAQSAAPVSVRLPEGTAHSMAAASLEALLPGATDTAVPAERLSLAREQLARQIARAASQGLLDGRPVRQENTETAEDTAMEAPVVIPPPNINLHAETSADHDFLERFSGAVQTAEGMRCFADSYFDVGSWGTDAPFAAQIGAARAGLSGEFDRMSAQAALELARLYIFFGFGAEARQMIVMSDLDAEVAAVSLAMARVLEQGRDEPSVLSGQIGCDAPVALWSALSYESLPANMPIETDAVLRALTALPAHLRRHLGPQLARKFVAGGQTLTAERVLRIIDRIPEEPVVEQALARAEMSIADGAPEAADADLQSVVDANTEGSAEALVTRIDTRLNTGRGVPPQMADLAGAYAHEYRDTPLGKELSRAYIEAMAASGDFDTAMRESTRLDKDLSEAAKARILATVTGLLTQNADDLTFLRIATDLHAKAADLPPDTANDAAARMVTLGFADLARPFVEPPASGRALEQRQLLRAEIALMEGAPRAAQIELLGAQGPKADGLRARALSQLGEHAAAHGLYLAAGDTQAALREALLAEDWQQAVDIGDPALADVVEAGVAPVGEDLTGVLARNQALLESSVSARETVAALLEGRSLPAIE